MSKTKDLPKASDTADTQPGTAEPVALNEFGQPLKRHRPLTWRKTRPNRDGSRKAKHPDSFVYRPHMNRRGVPDGWAGLKQEATTIRDIAEAQAEVIVQKAAETGVMPCDPYAPPETREGMVAAALKEAMALVLNPTSTARVRGDAARIVLDYTAAKPAGAYVEAISEAQRLLEALTAQAKARQVSAD